MSNHFHFVLYQQEPRAISRFMYDVCRPFALSVNKRQKRSGPLFDSRYDATVIDDPAGFLRVSRYVHANPVKARLSTSMDEWKYSSCKAYVEACGHTLAYRELLWALVGGPEKYRRFLEEFDPADPQVAEEFLCPEADRIWEKVGDYVCRKSIHARKKGRRAEK